MKKKIVLTISCLAVVAAMGVYRAPTAEAGIKEWWECTKAVRPIASSWWEAAKYCKVLL